MIRVAPDDPAIHDGHMGRALAICGWLAWQTRRRVGGFVGRAIAPALAVILVIAGLLPAVLPLLDPQPENATVEDVIGGGVSEPDGWVRLVGRTIPLEMSPTGTPGNFGLLIDADNQLRAIVVRASTSVVARDKVAVTGRLAAATVAVAEDLPIEATVAGTPPVIVSDQLLTLDKIAKPVRAVMWPLGIPALMVAAVLLVGVRVGYPIFRPTVSVDVLARPLAVGERIPTAYGGRVGPHAADLADPAGALLLMRRDERANLLTVQPLATEHGPAPKPVLIGGGWTAGRIGSVHTVSETVAALEVRSELVEATFLFARDAERDRVAAHISIDR